MLHRKGPHLGRSRAVPDVPRKRRQLHDKDHLRARDIVGPIKRIAIYRTFNVAMTKKPKKKPTPVSQRAVD